MQMAPDQHDQAVADALTTLGTRINDALAGFETMLEKTEPEFRETVASFTDLHARHAAVVSGLLAQSGQPDTEPGSLMGTVNKAVVTMRALVDRIDADVLRQIADGEQHVLSAFDDVLGTSLPQAQAAHIRQMRTELVDLMAQTGARV